MTEGYYPKIDGDILYASEENSERYQGAKGSTLNYAAVTVGNTATVIKAANANRQGIVIQNLSSELLYVGDSGVLTSDGFGIQSGECIYMYDQEAIYGITASGSADIRYLEVQ